EKYVAQVQHNMWVTHLRSSALSIITGGGKWVEVAIPMDPLYLTVLVSAEKKFWRCVQSGEVPHLIMAEPPRPRIDAVRIVDMSASNSWAEFAALFRNTRPARMILMLPIFAPHLRPPRRAWARDQVNCCFRYAAMETAERARHRRPRAHPFFPLTNRLLCG